MRSNPAHPIEQHPAAGNQKVVWDDRNQLGIQFDIAFEPAALLDIGSPRPHIGTLPIGDTATAPKFILQPFQLLSRRRHFDKLHRQIGALTFHDVNLGFKVHDLGLQGNLIDRRLHLLQHR